LNYIRCFLFYFHTPPSLHQLSTTSLRPPCILANPGLYRDFEENTQTFELQQLRTRTQTPVEGKSEGRRRQKLERLREAEEMKFSHSLQFNAVPDWSNHYVAYSNLKKQIYSLETQINQKREHTHQDPESSPLLNADADDPDQTFTNTLDAELEKVTSFYQLKENDVFNELDNMVRDEDAYDEETDDFERDQAHMPPDQRVRKASIFRQVGFTRPRALSGVSGHDSEDDSDDDANETSRLRQKSPDGRIRRQRTHTDENMGASTEYSAPSRRKTSVAFDDYNDMAFSALYDEGVSLKKRAVSVYVSLCELRSFIQLNKTGFEKVLKKYDKIMDRKLKSAYLETYVYPAYPFQQSTMDRLTANLARIEGAYAHLCTKGDIAEAKRELRLHLREHVTWERNTVWREMIGIERKAQAANIGITQTLLGRDTTGGKIRRQGDDVESDLKEVSTPIGKYTCPQWLVSRTFWMLVACISVFAVLLLVPIMEKPEQQNCLAMVIFVSLLWATEVCTPPSHPMSSSLSYLHIPGHTPLRNLPARPLSRRNPQRRALRRHTPAPRLQARSILRLRRHVDARHHAAARRLHDRRSLVEIQYCEDDGDVCAE